MKKLLSLLVFAAVFVVLNSASTPAQAIQENNKDNAFINYVWYHDEDMTDPTGTNSSITTEVNRLRLLWPGYTFSSSPGVGLAPLEWGYYSPTISAVIYSNL